MKPRHKRLAIVAGIVCAVGVAAALVLDAFQSNLVFFYSPSQVAANEAPSARTFRLGGMVEKGALKREGTMVTLRRHRHREVDPGALRGHPSRPVQGGQGRRRPGPARQDDVFVAREVLAKHDENYMPPEAAEALKRAQQGNPKLAETMCGRAAASEMIPELGHFALWLALGVAAVLGVMPMRRRGARPRRLDGARAAVGAAAVRARRLRLRLPGAAASSATTSRSLYVATNSNRSLPLHYRIAAVWGGHEGSILLWLLMLTVWTVAVATFSRHLPEKVVGAHPRRDGPARVRLPALPAGDVEPVRPAASRRRRRPRPQPAAAGPGHGDPPADALHGLRRPLGRVLVRRRGADRRQPRRDLGALDAAVDDRGVDLPHHRHRARQRLGLLRARLGRLVVLGPGRERLVHAVAGRAPR